MKKFVSLSVLVISIWVVTAQPRTTVYSTGVGPRDTASATLADDLENLCNCDRQFGPPAPVLDPNVLPIDTSLKDNKSCPSGVCQPCFDCYGWQLFLTLSWPSKPSGEPDPGAYFGKPGSLDKVGWENFASVNELFGSGKEPPSWAELGKASRTIMHTSAVIHQNLTDYKQADHNWLTDQDHNLVRFELRVNKDEYEYIVQNKLYNQDGLYKAVSTGAGIDLPSGKGGGVGAIETKAAWRIVPKDREDYFMKNYKVAKVKIPPGQDEVLVALVGLHVIKKTPNSPQWVWATFEHKDNVPMIDHPESGKKYNFFNPSAPADYKPNYNAPPGRKSDPRVPVQVVRVNPLPSRTIAINDAVHALISSKYPDSVWKNYNLINVQWPADPVAGRVTKGALPSGRPAPVVVANSTMETYMQNQNTGGGAGMNAGGADANDPGTLPATNANRGKSSCIGCHRLSAVTPKFKGKTGSWPTDYSTIFFKAR
jgi:hypothetical protein